MNASSPRLDELLRRMNVAPEAAMLKPCPDSGGGVHTWLLSCANSCRIHGLTRGQTERWLEIGSRGCGREVPQSEIDGAIRTAWNEPKGGRSYKPKGGRHHEPTTPLPQFDEAELNRVAARMPEVDEDWLRQRSPILPDEVTPPEFLNHVFEDGEFAVVATRMNAKGTVWPCGKEPRMGLIWKWTTTLQCDVFYLSNPVDGRIRPNPRTGNETCRSEENITFYRHLVVESDIASADKWLPVLAQLEVPITAVYTSGGKSIHALARIDAKTKTEWVESVLPMKQRLTALGADPAAMTAVRLTRLPGCKRNSTGGFQRLLYLNPKPDRWPLSKMPVVREGVAV
jgi:hypothetical protein